MQELLEIVGMPYTGSGVLACMRCMDKVLTKHMLREAGLPTPDFFAFSEIAFKELGAGEALPAIEERLGFPVVVKPAAQGSALGIKFARDAHDVPEALIAAFSYDDRVLLERHVEGRELAVSLLEGDAGVEALPIVEAKPRAGVLLRLRGPLRDRQDRLRVPGGPSRGRHRRAHGARVRRYRLLGCYGFARVDMILSADGEPQVLEAQAIPGLTETSLHPQAAEAAGISFEQLVCACWSRRSRETRDSPSRTSAADLSADRRSAADRVILAGARGEVLGRYLVEERLELVDDLLGVLGLVLELDRALLDHVLRSEDRRGGPHRHGEGVRGPRVDLDLLAVDTQGDRGEKVLSFSSVTDTRVHWASSSPIISLIRSCVMGRGVRGALELHQDRGRLGVADPDRQELVAVDGLQEHDRLLADHVEADPVDDHLLHLNAPVAAVAALDGPL